MPCFVSGRQRHCLIQTYFLAQLAMTLIHRWALYEIISVQCIDPGF